MKRNSHPHLNGSFTSPNTLLSIASIVADYQGKIAVVLAGPMDTDREFELRRSEIDGLAIGAAIDVKVIDDLDQKSSLYAVFRAGYIKAYKGGEDQAMRHGLDNRQPLLALRQALGIDKKGMVATDGRLGTQVIEIYNKVAQDFEAEASAGGTH